MAKKFKKQLVPIEKHDSAAWADAEETRPHSKVSIPSQFNVEAAKEWVENNQK